MTFRLVASIFIALGLLVACASPQDLPLNAAIAAYLADEPGKALPAIERYAQQGEREAIFYLGRANYEGKGVPVNLHKAAEEFVRAFELGDVAAPVWAGLAYESLSDWPKAAAMHRKALEKYKHITSMLHLAQMIRQGLISNGNQTAATRYFASAQAFRDSLGEAYSPGDYLAPFSCFELMQAAFVEEKSGDPTSSIAFQSFMKDYLACTSTSDRSVLKQKLVSASGRRLEKNGNGALDENATMFSILDSKSDRRVRYLPSPFKGYVAFASDADAADANASLSGQRYLNDHLGLPIANSVFAFATPAEKSSNEREAPIWTGFYEGVGLPAVALVGQLPEFFALARAWHEGRFDHFHSWYSDAQTLLLRTTKSIKDGATISLAELLGKVLPRYRKTGQVIRLYFSSKPAEDLRLIFTTHNGGSLPVNSANIVFEQRTELDEGKQRYVVVLRLPARFPQFAVDPEKTTPIDDIEALRIDSPLCKEGCDIVLEKIEIGIFDRATAIAEARLFRDLNIYPFGYTSHGGEGLHVHGDPSLLNDYWLSLVKETGQPGETYVLPSFPMANIEQSKGYIDNLLTEIGVRAVRPERLPSDRSAMDAIHDWDAPYKLFGIYRGKMNFATTYFAGEPPSTASLEEKLQYLNGRLKDQETLVSTICTAENCDLAQNGTIAALISASLQEAEKTSEPFSHIWYTHFGAPTPTITPTPEKPFSTITKTAFDRLSEAQYGFNADGVRTEEPRVLVASSTIALRGRKLQYEVESGLFGIDRNGDQIHLSRTIDPFLGGLFPAADHSNRDLANLTFPVATIFDAEITIDSKKLTVARRRTNAHGDAGEISIVDDESPTTIVFGAGASEPQLRLDIRGDAVGKVSGVCAAPSQITPLFNVSHVSFENPFYGQRVGGHLQLDLFVRDHPQQAFDFGAARPKRHVFTTDPETVVADKLGTTVHTIDLPRVGGRQPENIVMNLALPARYLVGEKGSLGDLNINGIVEKLCISMEAPSGSAMPATIGPVKFLSPTNSDRPGHAVGPVVGGAVSQDSAAALQPTALRFVRPGSENAVSMSLSNGFYYGKLPTPGFYKVSVVRASCERSPEVGLFIETNRLDIDFDIDTCSLKQKAPIQ